jgi:hemerythrin-like domain-containing protein
MDLLQGDDQQSSFILTFWYFSKVLCMFYNIINFYKKYSAYRQKNNRLGRVKSETNSLIQDPLQRIIDVIQASDEALKQSIKDENAKLSDRLTDKFEAENSKLARTIKKVREDTAQQAKTEHKG